VWLFVVKTKVSGWQNLPKNRRGVIGTIWMACFKPAKHQKAELSERVQEQLVVLDK